MSNFEFLSVLFCDNHRHRLRSSTVEHWTNSRRGEELEHWLGAGDLDRQCLAGVGHVLVVVGQSKDHRRMGVSGVIGFALSRVVVGSSRGNAFSGHNSDRLRFESPL